MPGLGVGVGVGAGLLPAILFGGVIGAGVGGVLLYVGQIEDGTIPDELGILKTDDVKAHSVSERPMNAQAVAQQMKQPLRGFAASRS